MAIDRGAGNDDSYPQGCPCGLILEKVGREVKASGAKFYTIALDECATKSFAAIAAACGEEASSFSEAATAIAENIIPALDQAVSRLLLQPPKIISLGY